MKLLRDMFKRTDRYFKPDGALSIFSGIYGATKSFFFFPSPVTHCAPHIRDSLDLKRFMSFVILALIPVTLFGIYNTGYQFYLLTGSTSSLTSESAVIVDRVAGSSGSALYAGFWQIMETGAIHVVPIILVSYGVGFFWEILFATIRRREVTEGFLVTGLLFPLTLPPTVPLWQVAVGISFGVVIGKEVFGGTGRNILNPALTARAFLFFSYPLSMSGSSVWHVMPQRGVLPGQTEELAAAGIGTLARGVDVMSGATPLSISGTTGHIQDLLVQAGYPLETLFWGLHPGSIGETSALLCFLGALFLIITGVANYRIIIGGVAGVAVTALIFQRIPGHEGTWFAADPLYHLFSGGFAFGISFMATDPVSAPGTDSGRWIYGFLIGFFTLLIRAVNPAYVEGVMLSILFMNIFSPLIDHIAVKVAVAKRIPNG